MMTPFRSSPALFCVVVTVAAGAPFVGRLAVAHDAEPAFREAPLKISAREDLQGPSQWGVPPDFRIIRSNHELVRAVGADRADAIEREFGRPKIDFQRYMLVYVSPGSQRSSGYAVDVVAAAKVDIAGRPSIRVRWSLYEPRGFVLWVITTPAQIALVERAEGEAVFERVPVAEKPAADEQEKGTPPTKHAQSNGVGENDAARQSQPAVNWDELVGEYVALGLPLPPDDAPLVAMFYDMELIEDRDLVVPLHRPRYLVGFVLGDGGAEKRKQLLVGTESHRIQADDTTRLIDYAVDTALPGRIVEQYEWSTFEINVALPTAIQCYRRGLKDLAEQFLRAQSQRSFGHPQSVFHQPAGLSPPAALRHVAWAHWGNRLTEKETDRVVVHRRMSELVRTEPTLNTPARIALLDSLAAALKPGQGAAGSVERLIDDLVDVDALYFDRQPAVGTPAPLAELARRGWEAIPTMLAHLDDRRLTRSVVRRWDGSASYLPPVGELVGNLLQDFAGDEGREWGRTSDGHFLTAEPVQAWWMRAQTSSEEEYLVRTAVPRAEGATRAYDAIIVRLAHKYPQRLPDVYRRLLAERPDVGTWNVVSAVAAAVGPGVRSDVLAEGAAHANLARQIEALEALSAIDMPRFESLLLANLARLKAAPVERYAYCDQASFARLCWKSGRADVWDALREAAAETDVGVRMEIIKELGGTSDLSRDRRSRLTEFLAAFLDDSTLRDTAVAPKKYDGCAASWWPKLEVRNWAAYQLAVVLGVDVSVFTAGRPVTDEQWARLRTEVVARRTKM